jgi:hypothetical protein
MLRNGVYEMHVPVTTHRQPVTRNVNASMTRITSTLHNTFNHAPATTLCRLFQHYRGTANLNKPRDPADVECHSCAQGKQTRARGVRIFDLANSNFEKVEKFDSN